jgi:hypothetical protein
VKLPIPVFPDLGRGNTLCHEPGRRAVSRPTYRLVVEGELDNRFAFLFGDLEMSHVDGQTVLSGPVIDQAQLHGFIERIEELGLKLISVQEEHPREPGSSG